MIMLKNIKVIMSVYDIKKLKQSFSTELFILRAQKLVHANIKLVEPCYLIFLFCLFLKNCCNAQVTVSFASANNLQILLSPHSSMYTSVIAN